MFGNLWVFLFAGYGSFGYESTPVVVLFALDSGFERKKIELD